MSTHCFFMRLTTPGSPRRLHTSRLLATDTHSRRREACPTRPRRGVASCQKSSRNHRDPCKVRTQFDKKIEVSLSRSGRRHDVLVLCLSGAGCSVSPASAGSRSTPGGTPSVSRSTASSVHASCSERTGGVDNTSLSQNQSEMGTLGFEPKASGMSGPLTDNHGTCRGGLTSPVSQS